MEITLEQAYEAALATIGRLTVEQTFLKATIDSQAAELDKYRAESDGVD